MLKEPVELLTEGFNKQTFQFVPSPDFESVSELISIWYQLFALLKILHKIKLKQSIFLWIR